MDIGSWVKQNKLAAGAIAAGGGFLYLSRKGSTGAAAAQTTGVLTPVAAAYPNEDMAPTEEAASTAENASAAADAAAQAEAAAASAEESAAQATDNSSVAVGGETTAPSPLGPATPTPSTLTPNPVVAQQTFTPPPPPKVVPATFPLPGDYSAGLPLGKSPGNLGMLIGRVLGYKYLSGGSNSNGQYSTFRFFSDLGNTGDWNFYYSGAKVGEWVGPFNFPRHAEGG